MYKDGLYPLMAPIIYERDDSETGTCLVLSNETPLIENGRVSEK